MLLAPSARASDPTSAGLRPPVSAAGISSPFGPRTPPAHPLAGRFHDDIDLPANAGAPVRVIASGVVIRVEDRGPDGLQILVQRHGFVGICGDRGSLAPAVAEGQRVVRAGKKLGVVGHAGVTYGMHWFLAMIVNGRAVQPAPYLELSQCRAALRRCIDMPAADGKIPPTRHCATPGCRG